MRPLTEFQRRIVQHAALGFTQRETARELGTTWQSVAHSGRMAMRKLDARSMAHAVHLAGIAKLISPYPCGDYRTYTWHLNHGVPLDEACRAARREYDNEHPWKGRRKGP
jgi:DNA-binding CsgD family transcriptional regulator